MRMSGPERKKSRTDAGFCPRGVRRLTLCACLVTAGLLFSYLEALLPFSLGIPGVKLGLANLTVVMALLWLGPRGAFPVALLRVLLSGLLFGNTLMLLYSLCGCLLGLLSMTVLSRLPGRPFGTAGISIAGGVAHNLGQLLCASVIMGTDALLWYLPVLLAAGTAAGLLVGLTAAFLSARLLPFALKR